MKKFCLVYITAPTKKEAKKITEVLLKEKLVACVNIFPIDSIYRWTSEYPSSFGTFEKIEKAKEFGMILKTKKKLIEKIFKRVKELHPYKVPCIISFSIEKGENNFLAWINKSTI